MTCSDALRRLTLAHRITHEAAAAEADLCTSSVSYMLNNKRRLNPRLVDAVCDLAGVDEFHRKMLHEMGAREYGWKV